MPVLSGQSNIHLDILMGRDEGLDVEDVFLGTCLDDFFNQIILNYCISGVENGAPMNAHTNMENKMMM